MKKERFHLEDRLRSFARMITGNYKLKVVFAGTQASITANKMWIPPLQNTQEAFSKAKFLVAHECGHDIHSDLTLKTEASKRSALLGDILNSLEDARIERLMTQRYEGLQELFETEIRKVISQNDYNKIPLSVQALHGLYMQGKGYDTSMLSGEAVNLITGLEKLAVQAANAKNNQEVLAISEKVYEKLKHLESQHQSTASDMTGQASPQGKSLPDMVIESLEEHRLDPDYDGMGDYPMLKDENVSEEETEDTPFMHPLQEYLALVRHHTRQQAFLIQHLRSIIETRRTRSRKRAVQAMQRTGTADLKRLWKLAAGEDRVLKQKKNKVALNAETDPDSLAVYILLDESHSMNTADRIRYSKEAVAVLGEVLSELKITFAVTGYTVHGQLKRYLYKRFDENYLQVRARLAGATNRSGTYTQEHIPYALRKLEERKERKKILLIATDAEEIESEIRFRRAVEMAQEAGVELLGLGINTSAVQRYFDRFTEMHDLQRLGEELLKLLKGVLAR